MKHLCYSRYIFLMIFLATTLLASLHDKSAIVYYGKDISYPMVGIHDYIIVNPKNTNVYTHGFDVYKQKMYAVVELQKYEKENRILKNRLYERIDALIQRGFENFMLDASRADLNSQKIIKAIQSLHQLHPKHKILFKGDRTLVSKIYGYIDGVVLESSQNRDITTLLTYGLDIIDIEYVDVEDLGSASKLIKKIQSKGMIPYLTDDTFRMYGKSSKNAIKREILTLIDETKEDRIELASHRLGALPLEYKGYIQKLYDVNNGLPSLKEMTRYGGVVVWLNKAYNDPYEFMDWILSLKKVGIKIVFADNFGANFEDDLMNKLGIESEMSDSSQRVISYEDAMMGFEVDPLLTRSDEFLVPADSQPLITYRDGDGLEHTPAAITPWGGYALSDALLLEMNGEILWVVNPFDFFEKALRLPKLLAPDITTQNGNRLMFSHIDGDGMMNRVESNPELFSGDILLKKILKPYKIPITLSVIGGEIDKDGLYPKLSKRLTKIAKDMYKLDNIEPATHTFTHPFFWGKIKNDTLDKKYRLKVKNYHFSLENELSRTLERINTHLLPPYKAKAKTVFWSGDCAPMKNALEYTYKHKILNLNGGDTTIKNSTPWLSRIAPIGIQRDEYYQIFTGAQNENVFTNEWLGPFWGFKKVVQTFKLTNSPRRLKPIDIYYHIYSASKIASLNALKYVYNWSIKQDVMPIFASEYIVKAMDYFTVSIAKEGDEWLVDGMRNLKTLRIDNHSTYINLKKSASVVGIKEFENHTYVSVDNKTRHYIVQRGDGGNNTNEAYLIAANANVVEYQKGIRNQRLKFRGDVALKLEFHLPNNCKINSIPKPSKVTHFQKSSATLLYKSVKEATVDVLCR